MFQVSPELHAQLQAHNEWNHAAHTAMDDKPEEPHNPWPGIVATMQASIPDVKPGFSDTDEICTDFIDGDYTGDFYTHIRNRYELMSYDAQDVVDAFKQFEVLREYSVF